MASIRQRTAETELGLHSSEHLMSNGSVALRMSGNHRCSWPAEARLSKTAPNHANAQKSSVADSLRWSCFLSSSNVQATLFGNSDQG